MSIAKKKVSSVKPRGKDVASSSRGLRTNAPNVVAATKAVEILTPALQFGVKLIFVSLAGYLIVNAIKNRFVKWDLRRDLDPANINDEQAAIKADAIYKAYGYFNDDFNAVANALSSPLLNHNGFVKLYNAYGHRNDLNLIEGIKDHFSEYEVRQLASYTNGAFFN